MTIDDLPEDLRVQLRKQQDPVFACIGGASAALVGAFIWALVTVTTKYQIGYMAIGVGLLVGFAVRYFGAGIDKQFGIIGAAFAFLGCALGNLLSQLAFISDAESIGYFEVLPLLNLNTIIQIYKDSFAPMDVLFYGLATYESYKFAFRNLPDEWSSAASDTIIEQPPYSKLRGPIVIGLFITLSFAGYFISKSSAGIKTFKYESGVKQMSGEMISGKENGLWEFWWENGNLKFKGYFIEGKVDSTWEYYNEDGLLYRRGTFKKGHQNGEWIDYYEKDKVSGIGKYVNGRQHGPWLFYYEDGKVSQACNFKYDVLEDSAEFFYPNGVTSSKGIYKHGVQSGLWCYWNESGIKTQEFEYINNEVKIVNTWNDKGTPEIINGNGIFESRLDDKMILTGNLRNGEKVGVWKTYYATGELKEEREYKNGIDHVINTWAIHGKPEVVSGEGAYNNYLDDESITESGWVHNGLRIGKWITYFIGTDKILNECNYTDGLLEGLSKTFYETGDVNIEGNMKNNKSEGEWKWYYQNGAVETDVKFKDGLKEGNQNFFNEEGDPIKTEIYKRGELIQTILI